MDGFTLTNSQYAGDNPRADDDLNFDDLVQTSFSLKNTDFNRAPTLDQTINVPEDEEFQDSKFEVVLKLSDLQGDPNSPLYSIKKFEELGLSEDLIRGIYFMNFRRPSKIQERALPFLLANPPRNMIAQSQSGTGKTAAFVLAILSRVNYELHTPQALILAPTRELARQIMGVIQTMGQFTKAESQFAIPTMVTWGKIFTAHIVVGTPGTVLDCIRKKWLPVNSIKVFVVDEADTMLDQQGMGDQCVRVKRSIPAAAQVLLWSATFPSTVVAYAEQFAPRATTLTLEHHELTVVGIKQMYMDCGGEEDKFRVLTDLYSVLTIGSSIIFVRRRETADKIYLRMTAHGHKVACLHSHLDNPGPARDAVIDAFRFGKAKVLITTNVLARGLDVATVSMVVNYDLPTDANNDPDPQTYLHRIGRTGRFGRVGVSISFVHNRQSWMDLCAIADYFNVPMLRVPADDIEEVESVVKKVLKAGPPKAGDAMEISRHANASLRR